MSKITIDRAVLETALEAMKKCDSALSEELAAWGIDPPLHHVLEASNACGTSIAALQEALAQPFDACSKSPNGEHSESWYANNDCDFCKTGAAADAPLYYANSAFPSAAQPKQEPAWWPAVENILDEHGLQAIDFVADFKAALAQPQQEPKFLYDEEDGLLHDPCCDAPTGCIPLFTSPPASTATSEDVRLARG